MRVFVTGASGFIGTALTNELLDAGHEVVGLARSDASAAKIEASGAIVRRGDLDDLDVLRAGATDADAVVQLAFGHDFSDYGGAVAADLRAVEALAGALEGSGKPFVITSGTLALAFAGGTRSELDALDGSLPRVGAEHVAISMAERGVRSVVVRLAPCVHDTTRAGLATQLLELAQAKGVSGYPGDGTNRWPAVHRLDAARLFRLALDVPAGTRLHGAAEEVTMREIAEAIGARLDVPIASIPADAVAEHFDNQAFFVGLDNPTSTELTRERTGWSPTGPGLLADLRG